MSDLRSARPSLLLLLFAVALLVLTGACNTFSQSPDAGPTDGPNASDADDPGGDVALNEAGDPIEPDGGGDDDGGGGGDDDGGGGGNDDGGGGNDDGGGGNDDGGGGNNDTGGGGTDATPDVLGGTIPGTWVTIKKGTFTMGSPSSQSCRDPSEQQHQVTLTHDFEMTTTETTQAQYATVMGTTNQPFFDKCGGDCPMESLNWHMAVEYCNTLSKRKGLTTCYTCTGSGSSVKCTLKTTYVGSKFYTCPGYRLPSEAEWEYAARAGTTTPFYSGGNDTSKCYTCTTLDPNADKVGWYCANSAVTYAGCHDNSGNGGAKCAGPSPVGKKQPNAWGLYDMPGNVWEWVQDGWNATPGTAAVTDPLAGPEPGKSRNLRGGSWFLDPDLLRSAYRKHFHEDTIDYIFGVRCARSLNP